MPNRVDLPSTVFLSVPRRALQMVSYAAGIAVLAVAAQSEPRPAAAEIGPRPELMQQKVASAQMILEGLATEDFPAIASGAETLERLTETQWRESSDADYGSLLKEFRLSSAELSRLAKEKNIDGAALAYLQLTLSCVNCHKALRPGKS